MSHYVYKFLNSDNEVIYIGRTSEGIKRRIYSHFNQGHLPNECYRGVDKISYCTFQTKTESRIIEQYLINIYKPIYNTEFKEYKNLAIKIDLSDVKWRNHQFKTISQLEEENTQRVNGELRDQNSKLSKTNEQLRKEVNSKNDRIEKLENALKLKLSIPDSSSINQMEQINHIYKFNSDDVEELLNYNLFSHIIFVGEIKINGNLHERITIKNEGGIIIYYFEKLKSKVTKDSLSYLSGMKNFSEKTTIALINTYGFMPVDVELSTINEMAAYIKNDKKLVV